MTVVFILPIYYYFLFKKLIFAYFNNRPRRFIEQDKK